MEINCKHRKIYTLVHGGASIARSSTHSAGQETPYECFVSTSLNRATSVCILTSFFFLPSFRLQLTLLAHTHQSCVARACVLFVCCSGCVFQSVAMPSSGSFPYTYMFSMTSSLRSRFSTSFGIGHSFLCCVLNTRSVLQRLSSCRFCHVCRISA